MLALFGAKTGRIGEMIRASLSVLGSDVRVFLPFLILFVLKAGRGLLALYLLYLGFVTQNWDQAFPLMLVFLAYLPFEILVQIFLQAAMSQMTRDVLISGQVSSIGIAKTLFGNLFSLLFIGLISVLVRRASDSKQEGFLGFLIAIVVFVVAEVWDLVSNFGISAIVVEKAGIKTLVTRLKELRSHVPEALVGVIGIDLAGGVAQSIFAGSVVVGLFGGGAFGYLFADNLPHGFQAQFGEITVNTLPSLSVLALSFTLSGFIAAATVFAKSLYFTSLYLFVVHKDNLPDEKAPSLEQMLLVGKRRTT
ncbi:hypothetical protein RSK20926_13514 [Roseobacter sp. SK209-2-6]|nr:hypothetical protein RSK20926_13514 [Roseobacter sp. SK209-2-6]